MGVSSVWYGGSRYRHDGYRGYRDYRGHAGQWQGHGDGRSGMRQSRGTQQRRSARDDHDHRR